LILKDVLLGVRLTSATLDHLATEERGVRYLCQLLGCATPPSWPPEHMDAGFRNWVRERLIRGPSQGTWFNWYVRAPIDQSETLVGSAGFKGPPNEKGVVEIGYSILDRYQRRGFGSAAVNRLRQHAFADPRVNSIAAETLPSLSASISLLKRCGFNQSGETHSNENGTVLRFLLNRS
jgi:[ribosomal protein S5]-alanine N-acetyltransferase